MIRAYAERDSRIVALANEQNHVWKPGNYWWDVVHAHDENGFFCWLDADDEFKPEFLEHMLDFAQRNALDVAACGNDSIDAQTGKPTGTRALGKNLILEGKDDFSENFFQYHQFMRTTWGKLYALSTVRKFDWVNAPSVCYGWDTLFATENFRNASRVGLLAESLYGYYVSRESVSSQWGDTRIASDRILFDAANRFLIEKCGAVSPQNEEFLLIVYMNAIHDTLNVLKSAKMPETEKVIGMFDMFSHEYTRRVAALENIGALLGNAEIFALRRRKVFSDALAWMSSRENVPEEKMETYCDVGGFVSAAAGNGGAWVFFKKLRARLLIDRKRIDEARAEIDALAELLPEDRDVMNLERQLACPSA
jgi:hypothetical protein